MSNKQQYSHLDIWQYYTGFNAAQLQQHVLLMGHTRKVNTNGSMCSSFPFLALAGGDPYELWKAFSPEVVQVEESLHAATLLKPTL